MRRRGHGHLSDAANQAAASGLSDLPLSAASVDEHMAESRGFR